MKSWKYVETQSRSAERIVKELGFASLPIDPFAIAKEKDIEILGKPLDGCYGCLFRQDDEFGIIYSKSINNKGFINFTIGHELGHYFLDGHPEYLFPSGDGIHRSQSGFVSSDTYEREADFFSVGLLMPRFLFVPAMNRKRLGLEAIKELASLCLTSLTATAIRYCNLSETPTAIIVSSENTVDYCILSEDLKEVCSPWNINGRGVLPQITTSRHHRSSDAILNGTEIKGSCQLIDWFDDAPDIEMSEDVIGLGAYGKVLTVLYADELIDDIVTEDEDSISF
ncbi:MAG: ImmA/IrrE family metallo-endopeptidase [Deltaproteobacteria bacterium]|nr:ImmA/IrrE family metallo-endopeptidase [Deltaproteobacteria bacterium]MBT4639538.1 ImmA/IrrE family metallo-endopeptidase [Deltaproteobacteria bacterium]MBT7711239.1 ImmA/IrrE family metallo-endopeptidase [Deltaproteobacteria bacterium]